MGWYEDDDAPGLARWWDGDRWTEHTMAIPAGVPADVADEAPAEALPAVTATPTDDAEDDLRYFSLPADDGAPLPPRTGPTRFPRTDDAIALAAAASASADPTEVGTFDMGPFGELDDSENPFFAADPAVEPGVYRPDWLGVETPSHRRRDAAGGGSGDGFAERFRSWPRWAQIALPVLAIALMVGLALAAVRSSGSGTPGKNADTSDATFAPPSSTTTAVTFVPLGPPSTVVDTSTTSIPASTTSTTARHTTVTKAPTTTAAPVTTTTHTTTTSSTPSTTTSTSVP